MGTLNIALAIANAVGADDWLKDKLANTRAGKLANKVIDIAKKATGAPSFDEQDVAQLKKDRDMQMAINLALIDSRHQLMELAYLDRADARSAYKIHPEQADKLATLIMRWNLPYIAFLLIANCVALYFLKDHAELLIVIGNVLGMAIKSLFDERKEVTGFYFGGSMQSSPDNEDKGNG